MALTENEELKKAAIAARLKLAEQALAPFEAAHRDLSALWATLETKAQGGTAIAGVFLGATITILTRNPTDLSQTQKTLILVLAVALGAAVVLALVALIPRKVPLVNDPEHRFRRLRDLLSLPDDGEFLSLLTDFYVAEKEQWEVVLDALRKVTNKKANLVFGSHLALAMAIIVAIVLIKSMLEA